MSIDMSYSEDRERLEKDRKSLELWLKDVEILTHINQFTDEDLFIEKYLRTHQNLSLEDLERRLTEIHNLFYITKNLKL